jgi:tetratricopeptide (TPR) repeat protein
LAYLLERAREFESALDCYARVLELEGDRPEEVHLNRAVIFAEHLLQPENAKGELNAALKRNPRYVPACLNLGKVCEQLGNVEEARSAYQLALEISPQNSLALSRLVTVSSLCGTHDPILERVREALSRSGIAPLEQADLAFSLGAALDRFGDYDGAFSAYVKANEASRESAGPGREYDRAAHEKLVDELIRAFPSSGVPSLPPNSRSPEMGPQPVFICGMFRSGSTLVERLLACHSRVTPGGELDLLPTIARDEIRRRLAGKEAAADDAMARLRQSYLTSLERLFPGGDIVTDKRPDNFLYIGLIKAIFPSAKIVHTLRDPLDNCLSIYFLHLGPSRPYATDLLDIAHWYGQYQRLMTHWKRLFGHDILDLNYDNLISDFESSIRDLIAFCDLEWDDACMAFHEIGSPVRTASLWQVRRPLYGESSGRWRHYANHLGELRAALGGQADGSCGSHA